MARVLIVEDDPQLGSELSADLERLGYQVRWVRDAVVGSPEASVIHGDPPEIVICDYFLPRGDGIELTRAWKSRPRPPIVVFLSGADVSEELSKRLSPKHWPERVFAKPIGLTTVVDEICKLRPPPAPPRSEPPPVRPLGSATPIELRAVSLPDVLWRLSRARRSGTLELRDPDVKVVVHLRHGDPVFVDSATLDETLGRLMVRGGILRAEAYERVLRRAAEELGHGEESRFGELVVEMGLASAETVVDMLRAQVREKLVNLFHTVRPMAIFRDAGDGRKGEGALDLGAAFRVDVEEVLVDGIRRHYGEERTAPFLEPHLGRYPTVAPGFEDLRPHFRFTAAEKRFLLRLRGDRTLGDVIREGPLGRAHAAQIAYLLLVVDALDLSADAAPSGPSREDTTTGPIRVVAAPSSGSAREEILARHLKLSGRPPHAILGVKLDATTAEVDAAYRTLEVRYAPERLVTLALGDAYEKATCVWAEIVAAYRALRDPAERALQEIAARAAASRDLGRARGRRSERFFAEAAYQHALRQLEEHDLDGARAELAAAREAAPDEPEYAAWEIWCSCLVAIEGGADVRSAALDARARIEAAVRDRRPRPRVLYALALACHALEDLPAARKHLEQALAFDPGFAEARRLRESISQA